MATQLLHCDVVALEIYSKFIGIVFEINALIFNKIPKYSLDYLGLKLMPYGISWI